MLLNLHISNLALIDELDIDFSEGLNILTGETGAGKSIIIGSIGIGLGGRFDASLLRDDKKDGLVELVFGVDEELIEKLRAVEIDAPDGEVLISRRFTSGRTVNRINDSTVTLAKLKTVAELLINLHAQHEQRTLMKPSMHMDILDSFDKDIEKQKEEVRKCYMAHTAVARKLEEMNMDKGERLKKLDYLDFEINEIEEARLKTGEDEELEASFRKGSASRDIVELTSSVYDITGYDAQNSAGSQMSRAVRELQSLVRLDPDAADMVSELDNIDSLLGDFNRQLKEYMKDSEFDENDLIRIENRLNLINSLKAKYGDSIGEIQNMLQSFKAEKEELEKYDELIADLISEEESLSVELEKEAAKLSDMRKKSAKKLCKAISEAMKELNFNKVDFDMHFEELPECTASGKDKAVFYISTNVGEKSGPLSEVASGGEMSRVLLAIKTVVSQKGGTPTLVFDEIDTGISGITAQKVGNMMKKLASTHQIISITHLPQIAAQADTAFVIEKVIDNSRTFTGIRKLDDEGRVLEIARLLGGENITESVMDAAREMLK